MGHNKQATLKKTTLAFFLEHLVNLCMDTFIKYTFFCNNASIGIYEGGWTGVILKVNPWVGSRNVEIWNTNVEITNKLKL